MVHGELRAQLPYVQHVVESLTITGHSLCWKNMQRLANVKEKCGGLESPLTSKDVLELCSRKKQIQKGHCIDALDSADTIGCNSILIRVIRQAIISLFRPESDCEGFPERQTPPSPSAIEASPSRSIHPACSCHRVSSVWLASQVRPPDSKPSAFYE